MSTILADFKPHHVSLFGEHTLHLKHRLAESVLFSDAALARLIENTPAAHLHINTRDRRSHNPLSRREGAIDGLSGVEALQAVRAGNIWINLHKLAETDPAYAELLEEIFDEFEACVPGLITYGRSMSLVISSPSANACYHCDVPGQMLWQMRGVKRVYVYPNNAPFLWQPTMEKVVLGEARETSTRYEPWFDDYADTIDLTAGEMLYWPLNSPHRLVNHECLNVSMMTEHWTDEIRKVYAVDCANGVLRRLTGAKTLSRKTSGPSFWGKTVLAGAMTRSGLRKLHQRKRLIDFAVDPKAPDAVRDIPAYALAG